MGIEGTLSDINVGIVLQMISLDQKPTAFQLQQGEERGLIVLNGGRIIHAKLGQLEGMDACYELLTWTRGHFRAFEILEIPDSSLDISPDHLVLEAATRLDEERRDAIVDEEPTAPELPLSGDDDLDARLFELFALLEQQSEKLKKRRLRRPDRFLAQLERALNLVLQLLFQSRERFRIQEHLIRNAVPSVSLVHSSIKLVVVEDDSVSLKTIQLLLANWQGGKAARQKLLQEVLRGLNDLFYSYLSLLTARFASGEKRREWGETTRIFLQDLQETMKSITY